MPPARARRAAFGAVMLAAAAFASGCATVDSFSGSASMRIDVEVYKGPLAQDPWTQFGELAGALVEASTALGRYRNFLVNTDLGRHCKGEAEAGRKPEECDYVIQLLDEAGALDPANQNVASLRLQLSDLADTLRKLAADPATPPTTPPSFRALNFWDMTNIDATRERVRKTLRDVVEAATRLRAKAFFYAGNQVVEVPGNRYVRAYMATFAFLASEYSNQIATRADALLQQIAGPDRRELPLSLHLRNTHPSDFINVFIWNRAGGKPIWEDIFLRPHVALSKTETTERVRTYEQLFGDYNWSNVNTVYTSGQGNVAMAFVKDDIGNWNLKSFDNDPTELLRTYVEVGKAALKEAARAVAASSGIGGVTQVGAVVENVSKAAQLVDFANRVSYGRTSTPSATVGGLDVNALHGRVVAELEGLKKQAEVEKKGLDDGIKAAQEQITALKAQAETTRGRATAERRSNTKGSEAELRARADEADREAYHQTRRVAELDEQINALRANDPQTQIPGLTAQKTNAERERDRQAGIAKERRAEATAAAQVEAAAVKIDAEAKALEEKAAALEQKNQQARQRIEDQPKAVAKAAREILDRHARVLDLLQLGVNPTPSGASGASGTSSATTPPAQPGPAILEGAADLLRRER